MIFLPGSERRRATVLKHRRRFGVRYGNDSLKLSPQGTLRCLLSSVGVSVCRCFIRN